MGHSQAFLSRDQDAKQTREQLSIWIDLGLVLRQLALALQ